VTSAIFDGIEYFPIDTAPRDGRVIEVMDPDTGAFNMRWNPQRVNSFVSPEPGVWEDPGGSFTWSEYDGAGPTWWRHVLQ
jgi:hypothetical protein